MKVLLLSALLATTWQLSAATLTITSEAENHTLPLRSGIPSVTQLAKGTYQLTVTDFPRHCSTTTIKSVVKKVKFNRPLALDCSATNQLSLPIHFSGNYSFNYDEQANTLQIVRKPTSNNQTVFKRPLPEVSCAHYTGGSVTLNLHDTFADGTTLREIFTQQLVTVRQGKVSLQPDPNSNGLMMLEQADVSPKPVPLNWRNANIYFVMLDRFHNGDTHNDHSYGRHKDGKQEIGTFHGGDLRGVIDKLDYIKSLGTDAIWLSPIVEQVHGLVGGGENGSFPFYSYHGYWARDFTKIDANFGNEDDLSELVTQAHLRGMKVLLDVVLNHSGYATLADIQQDEINVVSPAASWPGKWSDWQPEETQNWHSYNLSVNYQSTNWTNWWGPSWVRSSLPGYPVPGSSDTTITLAGLPDFLTESQQEVVPPLWLLNNPDTRVVTRKNYRVSDYLIEWQSDWVRRFGIDGYRVDTVKHVGGDIWQRLKSEASRKLNQWRETHQQPSGQPFWMMGEVWGMGSDSSPDYNNGFDALLNFDLQKEMDKGAACLSEMDSTYQFYADSMQQHPEINPVSYISSHDTELFYSRFRSFEMQKGAAAALLFTPGAIQVFYGDEIARDMGPYADDFHQGTRSDMLWRLDPQRQELLSYWQILARFRQQHPAIGAGTHTVLKQDQGYAFIRETTEDKAVIAFLGHAP
jgi:alpha-amylase